MVCLIPFIYLFSESNELPKIVFVHGFDSDPNIPVYDFEPSQTRTFIQVEPDPDVAYLYCTYNLKLTFAQV